MATSTIPAGIVKQFELQPSQQLNMRLSSASASFAMLVAVAGTNANETAFYYASGFSLTSGYHIISPIVTGSQITFASTSGTMSVSNLSSHTVAVIVVAMREVNGYLNYTIS